MPQAVPRRKARVARVEARAVELEPDAASESILPSGHDFGAVPVGDRTIQRGPVEAVPFPLRFAFGKENLVSIGDPRSDTELLAHKDSGTFDLVAVPGGAGIGARTLADSVVAVKAVDVGAERYRTALGIKDTLLSWVGRLLDGPARVWDCGRCVLHFELNGEPTSEQRDGLTELQKAAHERARELGRDIHFVAESPSGRIVLPPPSAGA